MASTVTPNTRSLTDSAVQTLVVATVQNLQLSFLTKVLTTRGVLLRLFQIAFNVLGFLCVQCTYYRALSSGIWFSTISLFGSFVSGMLVLLSMAEVKLKCCRNTCTRCELFYCSTMGVCFLVASFMLAPMGLKPFQAAAFFGFSSMLAYGFGARSCYVAIKSGKVKAITAETKNVKAKDIPIEPRTTIVTDV